jgi:hypothetical protein
MCSLSPKAKSAPNVEAGTTGTRFNLEKELFELKTPNSITFPERVELLPSCFVVIF